MLWKQSSRGRSYLVMRSRSAPEGTVMPACQESHSLCPTGPKCVHGVEASSTREALAQWDCPRADPERVRCLPALVPTLALEDYWRDLLLLARWSLQLRRTVDCPIRLGQARPAQTWMKQ